MHEPRKPADNTPPPRLSPEMLEKGREIARKAMPMTVTGLVDRICGPGPSQVREDFLRRIGKEDK